MKIEVNTLPNRKLVAIVSKDGSGMYIPATSGRTVYIKSGAAVSGEYPSLEALVKTAGMGRIPVYEGDSVTIQF